MTNLKLANYQSAGDSISLTKIGDAPFTIVAVEDSDYEDAGTITPGVKITVKESFPDDSGESYNRLHTTRTAVVNKLKNPALREDLGKGETLRVKCVEVKAKRGGKNYFDLVDV